ncbi:peptide-methionine (S)-S-oxide reductase MsrA [Pelagibacterium lacus]|uniref:Peptide methionine sulfoxide reductase MsrA n=1 Tax=Pelagibacterium lacus TaxID=2282655 RepID=A0A369W334_9HYPH|nr:peptide-methionine (S)-S-oxide reductase MsrA [Pelagibacterium lacus]RDE08948.1 peptide-methionine (S)-S-oxide reductase [Pelagibacterium lacus]
MKRSFIAVSATALALMALPANAATALFAGGCFWSVEANFDKVEGVTSTLSGLAGGHVPNPSYEQVVYSDTGHYEVVEIEYDPEIVSYEQLLTVYWHTTDPTEGRGQFCDMGPSYRPAIFALTEEQRDIAEASRAAIAEESGYAIVTEIKDAALFYAAEEYHQDFHIKNPARYEAYRIGCRRDPALERLWGDKAYLGTSENPFS